MQPIKIKIQNKKNLYIKWNDDSESSISLKYLRDECPCASCKGESILFKTFRPAQKVKETVEMYQVQNIETVGGYAIQIAWKDGHNTGIYSWEYLKKLNQDQSGNKKQGYDDIYDHKKPD
jgi:DUF971 family protein